MERFPITVFVNGVLSQRLIRRLCDHCKKPVVVTPDMPRETGLSEVPDETPSHIYESSGCDHCKNTGYSGRLAIHELFVLDAGAQRAVVTVPTLANYTNMREAAMRTLYEDGLKKVATGSVPLTRYFKSLRTRQLSWMMTSCCLTHSTRRKRIANFDIGL